MTGTGQFISVELSCYHTRAFRVRHPIPRQGDEVLCPQCDYRTVIVLKRVEPEKEWSIHCRSHQMTRGRTFVKKFGGRKLKAEMAAATHRRNFPGHVVDIISPGGKVVRTFGEATLF